MLHNFDFDFNFEMYRFSNVTNTYLTPNLTWHRLNGRHPKEGALLNIEKSLCFQRLHARGYIIMMAILMTVMYCDNEYVIKGVIIMVTMVMIIIISKMITMMTIITTIMVIHR